MNVQRLEAAEAPITLRAMASAQRGFTLIEMLIVVAIIGLLAGLVGPAIMGSFGGAQVDTAKTQMKSISMALDMYKLHNKKYPDNLSGLVQSTGENWKGPYLRDVKEVPKDPWGNDYVYSVTDGGKNYTLKSAGDGEELVYK